MEWSEIHGCTGHGQTGGVGKNRGYIFAGSEIYGGLANTWDYGPLGVEFKNNIKKAGRSSYRKAPTMLAWIMILMN